MAKLVGARVYNSANISIPDVTWTALTFNSERFDTDTIHSTVSNTGRLTCQTAGKYIICASITWASNTAGIRQFRFALNGTTTIGQHREHGDGGSGSFMMMGSTIYELAATDYVTVDVYQDSGGALDVTNNANFSPEFMMHRIG